MATEKGPFEPLMLRVPEDDTEKLFPGNRAMAALKQLLDRCLAKEQKEVLPSTLDLLRAVDLMIDALRRRAPTVIRLRGMD